MAATGNNHWARLVGAALLALTLASCVSTGQPGRFGAMPDNAETPPEVAVAELKALIRQAEAGDGFSQFTLGIHYYTGKGAEKNLAETMTWLRRAVDSLDRLADARYDNPGNGPDPQQIARYVAGYAEATIGAMFAKGEGVDADASEAARWFRRAADRGSTLGQIGLATLHRTGRSGLAQDPVTAHMWLILAVAHATLDSERSLAEEVRDRSGLALSPEQLAEAKRRAQAWQPDPSAIARTTGAEPGPRLDLLDHAKRGDPEALAILQFQAADLKDAAAQTAFGLLFWDGKGVQQDQAEAALWWREAAEQGQGQAMVLLGNAHAQGLGVPQSFVQAYKWLELAAQTKISTVALVLADGEDPVSSAATKMRDLLAPAMTPGQVREAQALARQWRPKPTS